MKNLAYNKTYDGFTLIEIMVAVGIFTLIYIAATQLLTEAQKNATAIELSSERTADLQRAMLRFEQDIEQLAYRPTRNQFGDTVPVFRGESGSDDSSGFIEFTRSGWSNPAGLPRSDLEHLIYKLEKGKLWRLSWLYLDHDHEEADIKRPLLEGITRLNIKFLKDQNEWLEQWGAKGTDQDFEPPRAVSIELEFNQDIKLKRIFRLGVNDQS
ncbi:MAG: type II secretion system protein GspJ [Gammaproteobacteria bacterium CG22_combo_CG10-13_8_21_14_all_40_8]|nr:MAG: type II secretion system protein GspJ [Gammaproteobacteria bacterium CG22_combo_CG10-13_8_21_14_all_40_8]